MPTIRHVHGHRWVSPEGAAGEEAQWLCQLQGLPEQHEWVWVPERPQRLRPAATETGPDELTVAMPTCIQTCCDGKQWEALITGYLERHPWLQVDVPPVSTEVRGPLSFHRANQWTKPADGEAGCAVEPWDPADAPPGVYFTSVGRTNHTLATGDSVSVYRRPPAQRWTRGAVVAIYRGYAVVKLEPKGERFFIHRSAFAPANYEARWVLHPTPPRGLYLKLDTEGDPDAKQLREGDWVDVQSKEFWPGRWHAGKVMAFHSDGKIVVIKYINQKLTRDEGVAHNVATDFPSSDCGTFWIKLDPGQFPCATDADEPSNKPMSVSRTGPRVGRASNKLSVPARKTRVGHVDSIRQKNDKYAIGHRKFSNMSYNLLKQEADQCLKRPSLFASGRRRKDGGLGLAPTETPVCKHCGSEEAGITFRPGFFACATCACAVRPSTDPEMQSRLDQMLRIRPSPSDAAAPPLSPASHPNAEAKVRENSTDVAAPSPQRTPRPGKAPAVSHPERTGEPTRCPAEVQKGLEAIATAHQDGSAKTAEQRSESHDTEMQGARPLSTDLHAAPAQAPDTVDTRKRDGPSDSFRSTASRTPPDQHPQPTRLLQSGHSPEWDCRKVAPHQLIESTGADPDRDEMAGIMQSTGQLDTGVPLSPEQWKLAQEIPMILDDAPCTERASLDRSPSQPQPQQFNLHPAAKTARLCDSVDSQSRSDSDSFRSPGTIPFNHQPWSAMQHYSTQRQYDEPWRRAEAVANRGYHGSSIQAQSYQPNGGRLPPHPNLYNAHSQSTFYGAGVPPHGEPDYGWGQHGMSNGPSGMTHWGFVPNRPPAANWANPMKHSSKATFQAQSHLQQRLAAQTYTQTRLGTPDQQVYWAQVGSGRVPQTTTQIPSFVDNQAPGSLHFKPTCQLPGRVSREMPTYQKRCEAQSTLSKTASVPTVPKETQAKDASLSLLDRALGPSYFKQQGRKPGHGDHPKRTSNSLSGVSGASVERWGGHSKADGLAKMSRFNPFEKQPSSNTSRPNSRANCVNGGTLRANRKPGVSPEIVRQQVPHAQKSRVVRENHASMLYAAKQPTSVGRDDARPPSNSSVSAAQWLPSAAKTTHDLSGAERNIASPLSDIERPISSGQTGLIFQQDLGSRKPRSRSRPSNEIANDAPEREESSREQKIVPDENRELDRGRKRLSSAMDEIQIGGVIKPTYLPRVGAMILCPCGALLRDKAAYKEHRAQNGCAETYRAVPSNKPKRRRSPLDALADAVEYTLESDMDLQPVPEEKRPLDEPMKTESSWDVKGKPESDFRKFPKPRRTELADLVGAVIRIAWSLGQDLRTPSGQAESELVRVVSRVDDATDEYNLECILLDSDRCRMAEDQRKPFELVKRLPVRSQFIEWELVIPNVPRRAPKTPVDFEHLRSLNENRFIKLKYGDLFDPAVPVASEIVAQSKSAVKLCQFTPSVANCVTDPNRSQCKWLLDDRTYPGFDKMMVRVFAFLSNLALLGKTNIQVDNCLILNTLKVKEKDQHSGQAMHFDGGGGGLAKFFGTIGEDHTVPMSVLIPMTGPAKLRVCHPLTQALRKGTFHTLTDEEREDFITNHSEILQIEVGELVVFTHDFCHCGEKDVANSRMFISFSHASSMIAQNQVFVV